MVDCSVLVTDSIQVANSDRCSSCDLFEDVGVFVHKFDSYINCLCVDCAGCGSRADDNSRSIALQHGDGLLGPVHFGRHA